MKLKREEHSDHQILRVTEAVTAEDLSVLRAGARKLLGPGGKTLILDVSTAQLPGKTAEESLLSLKLETSDCPTLLILCGDFPGADAPGLSDAVRKISSTTFLLLERETRLKQRIAGLEDRKTVLDGQLAARAGELEEMRQVEKLNQSLRKKKATLERILLSWMKAASLSEFNPRAESPRRDSLYATLNQVLTRQGIR